MFETIKALLGYSTTKPVQEHKITYEENIPSEIDTITKCLEQLGSSADEVADSLEKHKLFGARHNCFECPIAILLQTKVTSREGYLTSVVVSSYGYSTTYSNLNDKHDFVVGNRGKLPQAVQDFLHLFDYTKAYPQLDIQNL